MAINYNGDGTVCQVTKFAPVSISSSTNATPIVVTTSTNHGYATGDTIQIEGHKVNTTANGVKTITVLASNTFSINGSVGTGVGGATGICVDYAINPLWAVPSGGDTRNASSVSSPLEASANTVPFLFQRAGTYRIISQLIQSGGSNFANLSSTSVGTSFTSLTNLTDIVGTASTGGRYLISGDILNITFTSSMDASAFPSGVAVGLGIAIDGGADTAITESALFTTTNTIAAFVTLPFALNESYVYSGSSTGLSYALSVMAISASGSHNLPIWGRYVMTVMHLRPNS